MASRNDISIKSLRQLTGFPITNCQRAGFYAYRPNADVQDITIGLDEDVKVRLCAKIAHQNVVHHESPLLLDDALIRKVQSEPTPLMPERLDLALEWLVYHSPRLDIFPLGNKAMIPSFLAISYCQGVHITDLIAANREAVRILSTLLEEGLLENIGGGTLPSRLVVSSNGYTRYAHNKELQKKSVDSSQAFIAMWFDPRMKAVYDKTIAPAIRDAGYEPKRVDNVQHNGKIDDEIIALIRQSRFVVADFTAGNTKEPRGGVYYEAGFAYGLGREVIYTCRKDFVGALHFDTRQYNHIVWEEDKLSDFRQNLQNRIEATIGRSPKTKDDAE